MTNILAIDTSTDACSVALSVNGEISDIHELAPRAHSRRIFSMMQELMPHGNLRNQGIEAIAYACGPGSFTGLRIAASVVQGLAFTNGLPVIPVSTLACQAQTALRTGFVTPEEVVLSMLDARINEVYWALFSFQNSIASPLVGPVVCPPEAVAFTKPKAVLKGVGGGFSYLEALPGHLTGDLLDVNAQLLPTARDLIPLAADLFQQGGFQQASEVAPVYVRDEISWKKLSEQGKRQ